MGWSERCDKRKSGLQGTKIYWPVSHSANHMISALAVFDHQYEPKLIASALHSTLRLDIRAAITKLSCR